MNEADKPAREQGTNVPSHPSGADRLRAGQKPRPVGKVPNLDETDLGFGKMLSVGALDRELGAEIDKDVDEAMAGLSADDMRALFGDSGKARKPKDAPPPGPRKGRVISLRGKDVFVDVGGRTQGVLNIHQFPEGPPAPGTEVEVSIEGYDPDGFLLLSRGGQAVEADWSTVAIGQVVEARVVAENKGGLSVEVNGIKGFMPVSQIEMFRVEDLKPYIGQKLKCLVAEVDREERNLVVSRRGLQEQERAAQAEKLWATLSENQVHEGIVRSVKPFGAFVDIGGADGLLPTGEMSWTKIKSPEEVVKPGQKVRVIILRLDPEARKLTLGLRQLSESPWDTAQADFAPGTVVNGTVTRLADYGAFVEVTPGVEGLVHVSELSNARVRLPRDVVKEGQQVAVKVLTVDPQARRMGLSIKQAVARPVVEEPAPVEEAEEPVAPPKPQKPRTTPLRGGTGSGGDLFKMPGSK
ncbi:MAG: S1 RNA-binding domain-containing protein [Gemmataceae bacterium]|nr:S1 RNA-binding domain-containing protein [Gemmataceae bacterium]